jgi:hypothetical protein
MVEPFEQAEQKITSCSLPKVASERFSLVLQQGGFGVTFREGPAIDEIRWQEAQACNLRELYWPVYSTAGTSIMADEMLSDCWKNRNVDTVTL